MSGSILKAPVSETVFIGLDESSLCPGHLSKIISDKCLKLQLPKTVSPVIRNKQIKNFKGKIEELDVYKGL